MRHQSTFSGEFAPHLFLTLPQPPKICDWLWLCSTMQWGSHESPGGSWPPNLFFAPTQQVRLAVHRTPRVIKILCSLFGRRTGESVCQINGHYDDGAAAYPRVWFAFVSAGRWQSEELSSHHHMGRGTHVLIAARWPVYGGHSAGLDCSEPVVEIEIRTQ